jgi:hypothetical protein
MTFCEHYFEALDFNPAETRVEREGDLIIIWAGPQVLKATELLTTATAEVGDGSQYEFTRAFAFKSASTAGSVVLSPNTNGRIRHCVKGSKQAYRE